VLEPILHLFLRLEVIALLFELLDLFKNAFRDLVGLTHSERNSILLLGKLFVDRLFNTYDATINELLEVIMVEVESFTIPGIFFLTTQAVIIFQVENLLHV